MKKSITITIPEPCHEDWSKMTPTEKGKFCGVCTKEVFDFTTSNDEELIKRLDAGKSLCGRFNKSQLDREVKLERKSGNSLLPYAASLLLPLSILSTSEVIAQGGPNISENNYNSLGIGSNPIKSLVTVTGLITDENGTPISNAEVFVLETGKSVRTQPNGTYRIVCTSGSTIFSTKADLTSDRIVLGTKDAVVDMKIVAVKKIVTAVAGMIITTTETTSCEEVIDIDAIETIDEETIEGEIEIQDTDDAKENEVVKALRGKVGKVVVQEQIDSIGQEKKKDAAHITISGTVTDEKRLPLPGVNVIVKGTANGTQSDFDGNYSIDVQPNKTLVFSYLGYRTKEILASNISNEIDLDLALDADLQGEVIVLGGYIARPVSAVNNPFNYEPPAYNAEREARIAKRKQATANEVALKKIKIAEAKAARQLKKQLKKKK